MGKKRTLKEIEDKLANGQAVVMTAQKLCQLTRQGKKVSFDEVDVVTTATKGLMSGTSAIMAFRLCEPKRFTKVREISINDIPCYVGPCPNESLGLVDLMIHATDKSLSNPKYGAGHLLRDLVERKKVKVRAITVEGDFIEKDITLDEVYFAQMMGVRHAFRNYNAFINPSDKDVESIFTVLNMKPHKQEITICGTGAVNPLENDPEMGVLGVGTPILVNGALGHIIGSGTRSSPQRPNLMTIAPLHEMQPEFMGGFVTSNGPEVICSIAAAIPILDDKILNNLKLTDKYVDLNLVDIVGREVLATTNYADVWKNNLVMGFTEDNCATCELKDDCPVIRYCPTNCFTVGVGMDRAKCFNCGTCKSVCPKGSFKCDLGSIYFEGEEVPITLRQSDRNGAVKLMETLRKKILTGQFKIQLPTAKPVIYTEKIEKERDVVE